MRFRVWCRSYNRAWGGGFTCNWRSCSAGGLRRVQTRMLCERDRMLLKGLIKVVVVQMFSGKEVDL